MILDFGIRARDLELYDVYGPDVSYPNTATYGTTYFADALCRPGDRVIAGGLQTSAGTQNQGPMFVIGSYPHLDDGWRAAATNTGSGGVPLRAIALCLGD